MHGKFNYRQYCSKQQFWMCIKQWRAGKLPGHNFYASLFSIPVISESGNLGWISLGQLCTRSDVFGIVYWWPISNITCRVVSRQIRPKDTGISWNTSHYCWVLSQPCHCSKGWICWTDSVAIINGFIWSSMKLNLKQKFWLIVFYFRH